MPIASQRCQQTVRGAASTVGVGLHTGERVTLTLRPGRPDSGVVFVRTDAPAARLIRGDWRQVESTHLATAVRNEDGLSAITVEHLMAALRGCDVDNVVVELDGAEVPILDGSAAPLVALIGRAGLVAQSRPRRFVRVLKAVEVVDGDKYVRLTPAEDCRFSVTIDFPSRVIGTQSASLSLNPTTFEHDIARARTFGFSEQLAALRAQGLVRGGSLDNAIVVDGDRVLNPGGLRYPDEFARHKLLDSIGDLYLAGAPILGHYSAHKPGHTMNAALLAALFSDAAAFERVTTDGLDIEDVAAQRAG